MGRSYRAGRRVRRISAVALAAGGALAGLLTGGASTAQAAVSVPSWLMPMYYDNPGAGTYRACTGIRLTASRTLATPDCFTGRSTANTEWTFQLSSGLITGGAGGPSYRSHPQYNSATRLAAVSVAAHTQTGVSGAPVLASSADSTLYAAGAKGTFYSWAGLDMEDAPRVKHSEPVVVKSAADCATLLGKALPAGTMCTAPAPGAPPVADEDMCLGDAGGALVVGGKLVGISATPATGCAKGNVRLYSRIAYYRAPIVEWSRDVDLVYAASPGSVLAQEPQYMVDWCDIDPNGKLAGCYVDSSGSWINWDTYNFTTQLGDLGGDGNGDMLARTKSGNLYRLPNPQADLADGSRTLLGTGWNIYNKILATRDISGDGLPDVLARDSAGRLWMYKGKSDGKLAARVQAGSNYNIYSQIAGRGDLSGDGRSDIVGRDSSGQLWLHRGTGKGRFATRTKMGTGNWSGFNAIVASGDMDNNGRQDIIARTPAGAVYLFNADNKGAFDPRRQLAETRWKNYTRIS
ncbi:hypothetical protein SRB5_59990 [Streptomyces sp. RB5]|uniref:Peptidase S1 domain-containing protein n=1 Tax=Streptomyces smaragdinus TaxID=2585196 RepID=A0A7K0CQP0_9ACTN|nr:FG-GAP-like repeat-containing protein [Streptomyces smaragdinus]MQY15808.1 hypothetical protein [Streptomyces smaragdinus]